MKYFLNHKIIDSTIPQFTIDDRAMHYGDGIFETMRFKNKHIDYFTDHIDRLQRGCSALQLTHTLLNQPDELLNTIQLVTQANKLSEARIKIIVKRKAGGFFIPETTEADVIITCAPLKSTTFSKEEAIFIRGFKNHVHQLSTFKTLSSLKYVIAGLEVKNARADEAILVDIDGNISECLYSNIFWIKNNIIYTPSLETGCIDGIKRKQIIHYCQENQIPIIIGAFPILHLKNADLVFNSNINGLSRIKKIESTIFQDKHIFLDTLTLV
jgi:branched-chain amino acid aminotransferase/4-amino-4-deoxychorismate lyase